jgi:hypothetical protein
MRTQRDSPGTIGTGEPSRSLTGHPVPNTPGWPVLARVAPARRPLVHTWRSLSAPAGSAPPGPQPEGTKPASQPGRQCAPTGAAKYRGAFHRQRRSGSHSGKQVHICFMKPLQPWPLRDLPAHHSAHPFPYPAGMGAPRSFRGRGRPATPDASRELLRSSTRSNRTSLFTPLRRGCLDCQHGKDKVHHFAPGGFVLNILPPAP